MNTGHPPLPPLTRMQYTLLALLVVAAVYQVGMHWVAGVFWMHGVDYSVLWAAVRNLLEGHSVYAERASSLGGDHWEVFKYPQATALLFFWLAALDGRTGEVIWKLMMLAALVATVPVLVAMRPHAVVPSGPPLSPLDAARVRLARWWPLAVFLLVAAFSPVAMALRIGQIGPLLMLLMSCAAVLLWRDANRGAGVAWMGAVLVKVSPALLGLPLLLWRARRPALVAGLALAALYAAVLVLVGRAGDEWHYVTRVLPQIPWLAGHVSHSPFSAVVNHRTGGGVEMADYMRWQSLYGATLTLLYCAVLVALRVRNTDFLRALPFAIVGTTAASPLVEPHHFVASYPALFVQLALWCGGRLSTRMMGLSLAGWLPVMLSGSAALPHLGTWGLYVPGWANLWLWGVAAAAAWPRAEGKEKGAGGASPAAP